MKKIRELMALADQYAIETGKNNEYDNRTRMNEAREALLKAIREALKPQ